MDRSRRQGAKESQEQSSLPSSSRLTFKGKRNRKKTGPIWTRIPKPAVIVDACGRALRRSLPALVGAGVLAAIGGTAWAGYHFVTTSPRFAITEIAVHGNHRLTADRVRTLLPTHVGDNLFATDLEALSRALRADPWIAGAHAVRVLPHTLAVEIDEHVPAAVVELGSPYLVDAQGRAFKRVAEDSGDAEGLPCITGIDRSTYAADERRAAEQIRDALGVLAAWHDGGERPAIGEVHLDARAITLRTTDGATDIELGAPDDGLPARMRTFDAAWAALDDTERTNARALHLDTRSDHVTVAFR